MKLTRLSDAELAQLLAYCDWAAESGYYYGNQAQFEVRHNNIRLTLWFEQQKRLDKEASK